jgi:hypothetical protein
LTRSRAAQNSQSAPTRLRLHHHQPFITHHSHLSLSSLIVRQGARVRQLYGASSLCYFPDGRDPDGQTKDLLTIQLTDALPDGRVEVEESQQIFCCINRKRLLL